MDPSNASRYIAFQGGRRIASGELKEVALAVRQAQAHEAQAPVLVFDEATSQLKELDLRGSAEQVLQRLADPGGAPASPPAPRGPGRPRLGVVAREVTLLPRHWDWLNLQPGGASVALRKLVEDARRTSGGKDRARQAQEACYRFMSALAGNQPGFEEATRALFAGQQQRFEAELGAWPPDVAAHARQLAAAAFQAQGPGGAA
ncbi:DUF2239 family protein [Variovorax terrae]|uniref:DUF2239 family protein n=1 Tax=Variovorax terrae TaxID=2923278 RepID=A0A9X2AMF9_9BURK|nr:DUF2239 family protein [Variovorax terrae]MCJ0763294.1 DUF2239 family protein [Variovorax terrae]